MVDIGTTRIPRIEVGCQTEVVIGRKDISKEAVISGVYQSMESLSFGEEISEKIPFEKIQEKFEKLITG